MGIKQKIGSSNPTVDRADLLRKAARCGAEGPNLELARGEPNVRGQVAKMPESIKAPKTEETQLSVITNRKKEAIGAPANFQFLTPIAWKMALAQRSASYHMINEFRGLRAQTNIPRAVQGPSSSAALANK